MTFHLKTIWKHFTDHKWSAALLFLGFVATISMAVAIPGYAEAVNRRLLHESLKERGTTVMQLSNPFDFVFRYVGAWHGSVDQNKWQAVTDTLLEHSEDEIKLPLEGRQFLISTPSLQLSRSNNGVPGQRLERVKLTTLSKFEDQINLVDGEIIESSDQLSTLISLEMANRLGLKIGDRLILNNPTAGNQEPYKKEFTIAGIWVPKNPQSNYWTFYSAETLSTRVMILDKDWQAAVESLINPVDEAAWLLSFDGSSVTSTKTPSLLNGIQRLKNRVSTLLPNTDLESSPTQALQFFHINVLQLSTSILAFSLPVFSLFLAFLYIVSGILIQAQRNEIAVMRARGFSRKSILFRYLLEFVLLVLLSLMIALPLSNVVVKLMTGTKSFLQFSGRWDATEAIAARSVSYGLIAACICVSLSLIPVWQASKETINSYKQEKARAHRKPIWKMYYLDLVLIAFSVYGIFTQTVDSGILKTSSVALKDQVFFLLPFVLMIGLTLVGLRFLPTFLALLSKLVSHNRAPEPVFVTRQLSRSYNNYSGVLILLVLTLALATYTTTMAASLDQNLFDELSYSIGSDIIFSESGEFIPGLANPETAQNQTNSQSGGTWNFIPIESYAEFTGVLAASRVGTFKAAMDAGGKTIQGELFGVDRGNFSEVANFRSDFADETLIALMNRLASTPDAVLVDRETWQRLSLNVGDALKVLVDTNEPKDLNMTAVGVFDYFPTWEKTNGKGLVVANLDYIFESLGGLQPYKIWLKTDSFLNSDLIETQANQLGISLTNLRDRRALLEEALTQPTRQGVLGMLSIGFIISTFLAVVSFGLYAVSSLRERTIQLGIYRAIGMTLPQLRKTVLGEMLFLVFSALGIGTLIGWMTSRALVASLPIHLDANAQVLPRVISYDWGKVLLVFIVYGITLAVVSYGLMRVIDRMKLFMAIKLGETA